MESRLLSLALVAVPCLAVVVATWWWRNSAKNDDMAAQALLRKCRDLSSSVVSADDILEQMGLTPGNTKDNDLRKFLNTLKFTILSLLREDNTEQDRLFPPLAELAARAGAGFPVWVRILGSVPGNERVEGEAAKYRVWWISSSILTAAATRWLSRHQPSLLEVHIPVSEDTPVELRGLMEAVAVTGYSGKLSLHLSRSYNSVLPCDEVLEPLRNARCRLTHFTGCVSGAAAWDALAAVWEKGSKLLSISLHDPLTHQMTRLRANICIVTVRHCSVDDPALRRPLPDGVDLFVPDVPASGGAAVAGLLTCLAPFNGYRIVCLSQCVLSNEELHELTRQLEGVMTGAKAVGRRVQWTVSKRSSDGWYWQHNSAHDGGPRCVKIETE